jgi:diguanylate cyclase
METPRDSSSEIAKQTLTRLVKDRLTPTPENFCQTYRKVDGKESTWASFCHYTRLLEDALGAVLASAQAPGALLAPATAKTARELDQGLAAASSEEDLKRVRDSCQDLGLRMRRDLASSAELHTELVAAIQCVVADLGSVANEDPWLRSQLQAAEELLGGHVSAADVARTRNILQSLLERQRNLQSGMANAQQVLKTVMAEMIRQAVAMVEGSAGYETRISALGEHIQAANDLGSIKDVVSELDVFVKEMGSSVRHSHTSLSTTHGRLVAAEKQILDLRKNLAETSERVRRDNLTGALNRSGLDEIWRREVELALANKTPLSIGMLDVDNFKLLNDRLGHTVGDEALVHLTAVIRNALHGTDTMARYGGEEFVIMLPDTDVAGAEALMQRLQRELTKHFFLHLNERLLITFSAGVTLVKLDSDNMISAIERADTALYEAKRLGKNRVTVG